MFDAHFLNYFLRDFRTKTGVSDLTWKELGSILRFHKTWPDSNTGKYADADIYKYLYSRAWIDTIKNDISKLRNGTLFKSIIPIVNQSSQKPVPERKKTPMELWQERQAAEEEKRREEYFRQKREADEEMKRVSQELIDADN